MVVREYLRVLTAVRSGAGITEGSEISVYYDSMISKLIAYGEDRAEVRSSPLAPKLPPWSPSSPPRRAVLGRRAIGCRTRWTST